MTRRHAIHLLSLALLLFILVTACSPGGSLAGPEIAARKFVDALSAGDCQGAKSLISPDQLDANGWVVDYHCPGRTFTVTDVLVRDSTWRPGGKEVTVLLTRKTDSGNPAKFVLTMEQVNGRWSIYHVGDFTYSGPVSN